MILSLSISFHRQKIIKEKALPDIENYMFENHEQIRQAATECMCNLVVNKEVSECDQGLIQGSTDGAVVSGSGLGPKLTSWLLLTS